MAGPDRTAAEFVSLLAELERAPHEFDFFRALRRLECAAADHPRLGESARAHDDPIRLGQEPSLTFAPRTLSGIARRPDGAPPRLEVLFFGLFGPNGPLPLHMTEYARERIRHFDDTAFARFADIFHHRLLCLFYRAWANAQPTVSLDRPQTDRFADYVGSFVGLATPAMHHRDAVPDQAKLYFSGRLAPGPRHPEGLQAMLEEFFGLPVAIQEFVGQWTEIPPEYRCRLDGRYAQSGVLGVSTTIGSHVWDCQQTFRIVMGPMGLTDFRRLLPAGPSLPSLVDLIRNYLGDELIWQLVLVLQKEQAPATRLGQAGHLGLTAWLEPESLRQDADDFVWNHQVDADFLNQAWLERELGSLHGRPDARQPATEDHHTPV
jgi:type VI secretion system protein ImpH